MPAVVPGFDDLAVCYDTDFTNTAVGQSLRRMVWSHLASVFRPSQRVLELGCGTGEDAIRLATQGVSVVAVDASPAMIAVAQEKAKRSACLDHIEFQCMPMEDVGQAFCGQSFDGVFSNFGAVNCVRDLSALATSLAQLLPERGVLVWVIMGRRVPWEWLWYLVRGDRNRAFRRFRRDGVEWRGLQVRYPVPVEVTRLLSPYFSVTRLSPLGAVLPPTYAAGWLNDSPRLLSALTRLEALVHESTVLASWSDHYILEARRLPVPAE